MPRASNEWVTEKKQRFSDACTQAVSARLGKDLNKLLEAAQFMDSCRPMLTESVALNKKLIAKARPLRGSLERQIRALMKDKNFGGATGRVGDGTPLYNQKWATGWKNRISKAEAAWRAQLKRKAEAAKKKRQRALKSSRCRIWRYPTIKACGLVFSGQETCGRGPTRAANAVCRKLARPGGKCICK